MTLRLRPHHVLCSIGFQGAGYSDAFTANMTRIVMQDLRGAAGPSTKILITGQADAICAPCPKRRGLGCASQEVVDRIDARHATALGLEVGDALSWQDCLDRARARVRPDDLDALCEGCRWLAMGACKSALARLRGEAAEDDGP